MRLAEFIKTHHHEIIAEWESFASSLVPADADWSVAELRDHVAQILTAIVADMAVPQTADEQAAKSKGRGAFRGMRVAGKAHAIQRSQSGFQLPQLVAEYRALRASVLSLWSKEPRDANDMMGNDVTRFHEGIDEALTEATSEYAETVGRARDQFLATLGHDLRNPLGAILMSAKVMSSSEHLDSSHLRATTRIIHSAERMTRMVNDLLDLTRAYLGSGIPIQLRPVDLNSVCREVVAELEAVHDCNLDYQAKGDLHGEWDSDRLAQVVSNLTSNAVQYGTAEGSVQIVADGQGDEIVLAVHNMGTPIPPDAIRTIFEPMKRLPGGIKQNPAGSGLGLFIVCQIVTAHGGKVNVTSTASEGTTFTVRLPRHPPERGL